MWSFTHVKTEIDGITVQVNCCITSGKYCYIRTDLVIGVEQVRLDPGKTTQNGYISKPTLFRNVSEAIDIIESRRLEYNKIRSHRSLENLTFDEYTLKNSDGY